MANLVGDFYSICGETDDSGNYFPSPAEEVCQQWPLVCKGGIPNITKMCTEKPPSSFMVPIDDFCYMMSSDYEYVAPYNELIASDICDQIDQSIVTQVCPTGALVLAEACSDTFYDSVKEFLVGEAVCEIDADTSETFAATLCGVLPSYCTNNVP